jgi:glutaconate CoA-transferase subunit B
VIENTGFALRDASWPTTAAPTPDELSILRRFVDTSGELAG